MKTFKFKNYEVIVPNNVTIRSVGTAVKLARRAKVKFHVAMFDKKTEVEVTIHAPGRPYDGFFIIADDKQEAYRGLYNMCKLRKIEDIPPMPLGW